MSYEVAYLDGFQGNLYRHGSGSLMRTRSCPSAACATRSRRASRTTSRAPGPDFSCNYRFYFDVYPGRGDDVVRSLGGHRRTRSRRASTSRWRRRSRRVARYYRDQYILARHARRRRSGATRVLPQHRPASATRPTPIYYTRRPQARSCSHRVPRGAVPSGRQRRCATVPFLRWFAAGTFEISYGTTSRTPPSATPTCSRPAIGCHTDCRHGRRDESCPCPPVRRRRDRCGACARRSCARAGHEAGDHPDAARLHLPGGRARLRTGPRPARAGRASPGWRVSWCCRRSTWRSGCGRWCACACGAGSRGCGWRRRPPGGCSSTALVAFLLRGRLSVTASAQRTRSILITGSSFGHRPGHGGAVRGRAGGACSRACAGRRRAPRCATSPAERGWRLETPALDVTRDESVAAAVGDVLREDRWAARRRWSTTPATTPSGRSRRPRPTSSAPSSRPTWSAFTA